MDAKGRAVAAILLSSLFWGSSFPVIGYGVRLVDPMLFLFLRFAMAAPLAIVVMAVLRIRPRHLLASPQVWLLGALNSVAFLMQYMAQEWTGATNTALMINLYLVFVGIGSMAFLHERPTGRLGVAVCIGFLGVIIIETGGGSIDFSWNTMKGDLLALAAGVVWAAYIILSKMLLSKKSPKKRFSPEELTCGVCITTLVPLFFLVPQLRFETLEMTSSVALLALYLAIFTTILAYLLWYKGLKELSATSTSVLLLLEIAFAAIISYLWLGEKVSLWTGIGGILVCTAAVLSVLEK